MNPRGTLPISTYVNPLYKAKKEKKDDETRQSEEKRLDTIISENKERASFVPKKYKSTTPRSSKATTERKPQNINLMPARPEKIKGGLTKIGHPSFFPDVPGAVSPRGKFQPSDAPKIRRENISPDTIDEGKESSGESAETESPEKQHFAIPGEKPSRFKTVKPSAAKPNLRTIVSSRERINLPESADSDKAPSDGADFQERRRVPLLRTDRVLQLEKRVRASDLPRALTQRSAVAKRTYGLNLELQGHPIGGFGIEVDSPNLPELSQELLTIEANLEPEIFNINPTRALHDAETDDASVQVIPSEIREEHETSSDFAPSKNIESYTVDPEITISSTPEQEQPEESDTSSDIDMTIELLHLEQAIEIDPTPRDKTEELAPRTERRGDHRRLESQAKASKNIASQMVSSTKMAADIDALIRNSNDPGTENPRNRAINMLACAAGAKNVYSKALHPETMYAKSLTTLPAANRLPYLKVLYDKLKTYLSADQQKLVEKLLKRIEDNSLISADANSRDFALTLLKSDLRKELGIAAPQ